MLPESLIEFAAVPQDLKPLPIRAEWILEGSPSARAVVLSTSSDRTARTVFWDCTAGRFNWFYDIDETIHVLEGSVTIKDPSGQSGLVNAGETLFCNLAARPVKHFTQLAFLCCVLSAAPARAQTAPDVIQPRMDPKLPLLIGDEYYPSESRRAYEVGSCAVAVYVDSEGWVTAVQVVTSTGFPRLDAACIKAFDHGRMIPASTNGVPTSLWTVLRITWTLTLGKTPTVPLPADGSTPRMSTAPHVGDQYYPAEARAKRQQGSCLVVAKIGADGEARNPAVVKSTGAPSLDRACLRAVTLASFMPQTRDGIAVDASIELALYWRLK